MHGGNRDFCGTAATPARLVVAAALVMSFLARSSSSGAPTAPQRALERVPRARRRVQRRRPTRRRRRRCRRERSRASSTGRARRTTLAARAAHGAPARRRAQGSARRVVRAVLAHAVRIGSDGGGARGRLPLRDLRREPLRRHVGASLARGTSCSAWLQSPPHRANLLNRSFRDVGAAAGSRERAPRTARTRSCGPPRSRSRR